MKMDLQNKYFHGLAGGIPFWEEDEVVKKGLKQLEDIIKLRGIYSRRILKEKGIVYDEKDPVYNGEDYISVCVKDFDESKFSQYSNKDSIDISRFAAITVGMESRFDRQKVAKTIKNMLNYFGIYTVPITDTEGEILELENSLTGEKTKVTSQELLQKLSK